MIVLIVNRQYQRDLERDLRKQRKQHLCHCCEKSTKEYCGSELKCHLLDKHNFLIPFNNSELSIWLTNYENMVTNTKPGSIQQDHIMGKFFFTIFVE